MESKAPAGNIWAALADIGGIHRWNPGVVDSRETSEGETRLGATRRCDLGGKNYLDEEVVKWTPDREITFRITDTNLPFARADIHFAIEELAGGGSRVSVSPDYALKFGILGRVLDGLVMNRMYRKGMRDLLAGLKAEVERSAG